MVLESTAEAGYFKRLLYLLKSHQLQNTYT